MEALPWFWIWVILAALLCVGEMLTASFFLLPFGVGAIVAALAAVLGVPLFAQWLIFIVVSVIALFALRPLARRITKNTGVRSGAERLVGLVGEVIDGEAPGGLIRVRVDREEWNANVVDGSKPAVGAPMQVVAIDGTRLVVQPWVQQ
ncbi:MAG: NfeD family protein [Coriobacteriia bacterium]|jgi:membrane protein implicated in regulation of membrane protease activity|nr:NfeD family protein [Coriobacteriia bacterium]MDR2714803.1 NfeD family protein [Coriobacteriales bacterium]